MSAAPAALSPRLLDLLVCPICRGALDEASGGLDCRGCGRSYAVTDGIPRLVPEDLAELAKQTADAFGWSWSHFDEMHPEYERQFLGWIEPLRPADFEGRVVLDAGCGKGRHAYFAAAYGATQVVGIDLSRAVDVAAEVTRRFDNVDLVQGDLTRPPFPAGDEGRFDLVYSIGVLHHLPVPEDGFRALVRLLKPNGRIHIWVYGYEGNAFVRRVVEPLRRVTTRMPPSLMRTVAWPLGVAFHGLVRGLYGPLAGTSLGKRLPMAAYISSLRTFDFRQNYSIVFDQLVAPTSTYLRRDELERWFREAGLEDVLITQRTGNSWRASGRRPAGQPPPS